jgi:hypothetical protein
VDARFSFSAQPRVRCEIRVPDFATEGLGGADFLVVATGEEEIHETRLRPFTEIGRVLEVVPEWDVGGREGGEEEGGEEKEGSGEGREEEKSGGGEEEEKRGGGEPRREEAPLPRGVEENGDGTFTARIRVSKKYRDLGTFPNPELASAAYERAHGAHSRK